MIAALAALICATAFTMVYAKNQTSNLPDNQNQSSMQNDGETPPDLPENEMQENGEEPPAKPEEESDASGSGESAQAQESSDNGTPPEIPDNQNSGEQNTMGDAPQMQETGNSSGEGLSTVILFAVEALAASLLIIYLIMSGFNKKSLKQTFKTTDKVIIFILAAVILTGGLTFAYKLTAEKLLPDSSQMQESAQQQSASVEYSSVTEITTDTEITSGSYESSSADENAISASGNINAVLSNITVDKTGDSNGGDNTSFYGTNSAITAKSGASLTLKNISVTTNATGANGVFCYGGSATTDNSSSDGTVINISDSTITTYKDASGGIMATGGGILNAENLTVETNGVSSAAIRTDRGGGTVNVSKGTYTTNAEGSPAIYSTADITVSDAKLISNAAEGIVIEGKNSVEINNCELIDSNTKLNGQSTTYKNIFLYQSVSGDAAEGTSEFTANNSVITTNKGDSFYVTNTQAVINLKGNTITNNDKTGNFLRIQKDSWGQSGSNGGDVTLTMENQSAVGNIVADEISTLDMTLSTSSYYEGTINADGSAKSLSLTIDKSSTIKLTGDSYVTSLNDEDTSYSNIDFNGYTLYVNGEAIN